VIAVVLAAAAGFQTFNWNKPTCGFVEVYRIHACTSKKSEAEQRHFKRMGSLAIKRGKMGRRALARWQDYRDARCERKYDNVPSDDARDVWIMDCIASADNALIRRWAR
jgi:hypothetical protein